MDIKNTFQQLVDKYRLKENDWEKISLRYSIVRIAAFLVAIFLFVYFANAREGASLAALVIFFPILFGLLVSRHNDIIAKKRLAHNLRVINEQEIKRCDHQFGDLPSGDGWMTREHPYAYDLDIFGRNSLFQLLNRTSTPSGEYHLSQWLLHASPETDIKKRQEAVDELSNDMTWNQRFQAVGRLLENVNQSDLDRLLKWLKSPPILPSALYRIFSYLNPFVILVTIGFTIAGLLTLYVPILLVLANGFILRKFQERLTRVTHSTSGNARLLRSYGSLIGMIEEREFQSGLLIDLRRPFHQEKHKATRTIQRIRKLADFLDARGNLFYQLSNFIFLLDIHLISAAENWKQKNREDIGEWFSNIGKIEGLISLAGFKIAHPEYALPELTMSPGLEVKALGHPLIPKGDRVTNDFSMEGNGRVSIVTGSNMSGKSTFLRTVGINAVLAYAGAVVSAQSMSIGLMRIFTGMRTEDNLEEHISSFYAELKRIRQLLDYIEEEGHSVLYMLDEILKGTNTKDRHRGSEALIRKLATKRALGFVSTHDLELGRLADNEGMIRNYSFNSEIHDNEIIFDYKIADGICRSFNASMLMKKIGILEDEK